MKLSNFIQEIIMWGGVAVLATIAAAFLAYLLRKAVRTLRHVLSTTELAVFLLAAGICTFAAQKRDTVKFFYTDIEKRYLRDNGSYVEAETDIVYIDYRTFMLPSFAIIYLDMKEKGSPDDAWETYYTWTAGSAELPLTFVYSNATNYEWCVYTTYTEAPPVQTNGVWHINWNGRDAEGDEDLYFVIPTNTEIFENGKLLTPKKREED